MSNTFKDLGIEQVSVLMNFIFLWRRQISKANKYIKIILQVICAIKKIKCSQEECSVKGNC